jgi:hypothetical protein
VGQAEGRWKFPAQGETLPGKVESAGSFSRLLRKAGPQLQGQSDQEQLADDEQARPDESRRTVT